MERVTLRDTQRNNHPLGEAHLLQTAPRTQVLPLGPPPRPPPIFALPQTPPSDSSSWWLAGLLSAPSSRKELLSLAHSPCPFNAGPLSHSAFWAILSSISLKATLRICVTLKFS